MKMKKIVILFIVVCSNNLVAQTSSEFVNDVSFIEVLSKFGKSNMYMRALEENDFKEIPATLINIWNSTSTKYVNEEGNERTVNEDFFEECVRPIGRIQMNNNFNVVLFCKFEDEGSQKFAVLASFNSSGDILSIEDCYAEVFEMTGFFMTGASNRLTILTSGEEYVTEDIIKVNDKGYFETVSYKDIENYSFD